MYQEKEIRGNATEKDKSEHEAHMERKIQARPSQEKEQANCQRLPNFS